ncbi:hypothetical protein [Nostoc flagelliforme]|uniref:hypothetical protein n=1 Tax=Nostoc flagelliforme TaxID=1306274 RepID=UPI0030D9AE6B
MQIASQGVDNKSVNWLAIAGGGTDERYWCGYRRTLEADDKRVGVARRRHRLEEKRNSLCFALSYASDD